MEVKNMSFIYKITNDIYDKIYVGKTNLSLHERFLQHCRDSQKESISNRPLYKAMNKYGVNHFQIELIEKCSSEEASLKEQYWIGYYQGYENGYNATKGGDGKCLYNHNQIANRLKNYPFPKEVALEFNCSVDTVYIVAKEFDIPVQNKGIENVNKKKTVSQYSKNNEYLQSFESIQNAGEWLLENNIISTLNSGVRSHISEVMRGKRKTAYGYIWR